MEKTSKQSSRTMEIHMPSQIKSSIRGFKRFGFTTEVISVCFSPEYGATFPKEISLISQPTKITQNEISDTTTYKYHHGK